MREIPRPSITAIFEDAGGQVVGRENGKGWAKARCCLPGHEDQVASAMVNEESGKWNCMGCDKHGDAIDLIRELHSVDFKEALEMAAKLEGGISKQSRPPQHRPGRRSPNAKTWKPPWRRND